MLFETAFLTDFESGPFVADLLSVFILIIALRFTDLRSVLIIIRFSNSSAASVSKTHLLYFGEGMSVGGLFLLHTDAPGCFFTPGWGSQHSCEGSVPGERGQIGAELVWG